MVNGAKCSVHCLEYSNNIWKKICPEDCILKFFLYKNILTAEKSELRNFYMYLYMYLCHLSVGYQHLHCIFLLFEATKCNKNNRRQVTCMLSCVS